MVGNLNTGGIIGLTAAGNSFCHAIAEKDIPTEEVPENCRELIEHLRSGGYLADTPTSHIGFSSAYVHVSQRCDLRCRFCYSERRDRKHLTDPSLERLCRAINLLAELGCTKLIISGGEPFLRDDLVGIVRHAHTRGMNNIAVLTNGLSVTKKNVEPLAEFVSCIAVAFDGASPDARAHLRGTQHFKQLVKAIEAIRDAGIEARILPTLHAKNLDDIPRYQQLAHNLGATLNFSLLTADTCALGDFALMGDQLRKLGVLSADGSLPIGDSFEQATSTLSVRRSCGAGSRTLSVAADGTIYPCHMLHRNEFAMGNAFFDYSGQIRESIVIRRLQEIGVDSITGCKFCSISYVCGGGCRARAYLTTGKLESQDPYCELSRSYYEEVGRLLGQRIGRG